MVTHPHWLPQLIATADKYEQRRQQISRKLTSWHTVGGRIHAEIHPHRSEEGGTRSFRFSYSNPPLQQMPSRDQELGPLIRGCSCQKRARSGRSRIFPSRSSVSSVHYAVHPQLPGAQAAAERYRTDPNTDFHAWSAR